MAGNNPVASCDPVVSSPPPHAGGDVQSRQGTMAVQAGGYSVGIEYNPHTKQPPPRPSQEGHSGTWDAILSFFGRRKAAPTHKRPPSVELQPGPDKPPRQDQVETILVKAAPTPQAKPTKPFPFLDLPFELLCEVIARVPPGERHFFRSGSPLGTTCRAFHDAVNSVATMAPHRDDDVIARRVAGMQWSYQVVPMVDALMDARPSVRNWALPAVVRLTGSMSETGRREHVKLILERAKNLPSLWQLELMRHFAQWLPDTDSELLSLLTDRALKFDARSEEEYLARARVLAQLAQRINPHDLPGTVRRWESIYEAVSACHRSEDILTVRGLRAGYDHLSDTFQCKFNVDSEGMLLCKLIWLYRAVDSPRTRQFLAACTESERVPRRAPTPLPGTVKPHDPMRAYSRITVKSIPQVDRLPSHIM